MDPMGLDIGSLGFVYCLFSYMFAIKRDWYIGIGILYICMDSQKHLV